MERIHRLPIPRCDLIQFDHSDYGKLPKLGLCASCIAHAKSQAGYVRVGYRQSGLAADLFDAELALPSGRVITWQAGSNIDARDIPELARLLGPGLSLQDLTGAAMPLFAETVQNGTHLCSGHVR